MMPPGVTPAEVSGWAAKIAEALANERASALRICYLCDPLRGHAENCPRCFGWGFMGETRIASSEYTGPFRVCEVCDGSPRGRRVALTLHPTARDPYGTITMGYLGELVHAAESFRTGWLWSSVHAAPPTIADLRDFLHSYVDLPEDLASRLALYVASGAWGFGRFL